VPKGDLTCSFPRSAWELPRLASLFAADRAVVFPRRAWERVDEFLPNLDALKPPPYLETGLGDGAIVFMPLGPEGCGPAV